MKEVEVKVKKVRRIKIPYYHYHGDSGIDLINADKDFVLKPFERKIVPTGIKVEIPYGFEIQVRPRSGLALKHGITVLNTPGTVDSTYRGEIMVIIINLGEIEVKIKKGDRIAQAVLMKVEKIKWKKVKKLNSTKRGKGGFGSTGKK